jgi:hypothetical protein
MVRLFRPHSLTNCICKEGYRELTVADGRLVVDLKPRPSHTRTQLLATIMKDALARLTPIFE